MTKREFFTTLLLLVAMLVGLAYTYGVEYQERSLQNNKLKIIATTGMIGDVVRNIGGDKVDVNILMGAAVDPHSYEATPTDSRYLTSANIVFYNGLHLEGGMHHSLESLSEYQHVYAVSDGLDKKAILADPDFPTGKDPHIWHNVSHWIKVTRFIAAKLKEHDPTNAALYEANSQKYIAKLKQLHQDIETAINKIPIKKRVLVVCHDAFGYFAKAYNAHVKSLQGISTVTELGTYSRIELENFIKEHHIKAVFIEYSVNHKGMYSIMEACQQGGHPLICYEIYSDTIGAEGTEEGTYIGAMRHNLKMIIKGLTYEEDK